MEESVCIGESLSCCEKVLSMSRPRRDSTGLSNSLMLALTFSILEWLRKLMSNEGKGWISSWGYSCLNSHAFEDGMGESNRKIAINKEEPSVTNMSV